VRAAGRQSNSFQQEALFRNSLKKNFFAILFDVGKMVDQHREYADPDRRNFRQAFSIFANRHAPGPVLFIELITRRTSSRKELERAGPRRLPGRRLIGHVEKPGGRYGAARSRRRELIKKRREKSRRSCSWSRRGKNCTRRATGAAERKGQKRYSQVMGCR